MRNRETAGKVKKANHLLTRQQYANLGHLGLCRDPPDLRTGKAPDPWKPTPRKGLRLQGKAIPDLGVYGFSP